MVQRFTENTVRLRPLEGERLQAADFGQEQIGQGIAKLGQAGMQFAEAQDRINAIYDEGLAKKADAEAMAEIAQIKSEAMTAQGFDAQTAVENARKRIEEVRRTRISSLPSQRAQAMFSDVFTRRSAADFADLSSHATKQVIAARQEATKARAESYGELAVNSWSNPESFKSAVDTTMSEVAALFPGAAPEVIAQKQAEARSNIHARIAEQIYANSDDPLGAKKWVDDHAGEILSSDETKIRKMLQPGVEEAALDAYEGMVDVELATGNAASDLPEDVAEDTPAAGPEDKEVRAERAKLQADPLRGKASRMSTSPQAHQARNGRLAVDYAAPEGTPIYPPMSGKVIEKGFKPGGNGHYVKVRHPNGHVSTYLHMRAASPLEVDDEVTADTVLGGVGSTGKSTGNHLDYSVVDAKGRAIDPVAASWEEEDLPMFRPERNDKAALYAAAHRVATKNNMPRAQYNKLLERIDRRVAREDNLRARAREDVSDRAWTRIAELGENFTSLSQVPEFAGLDPKEKITIINRMEENIKGTEPEAAGSTYLDYLEMSGRPEDQDAFLRTDFRKVDGITRSERAQFIKMQQALRGPNGKPTTAAIEHSRIWGMLSRFTVEAGIKTGQKATDVDRKRQAKLFDRVNTIAQNMITAQGGKPLTDDQLRGIVAAETINVTVHQESGNTQDVPRYIADEVENATRRQISIPNDIRDAIATRLSQRGIPVTPEAISQEYIRGLRQEGLYRR